MKIKFVKKNQVILAVMGLMLITAGYLNYTNNNQNNIMATGTLVDTIDMADIGDATLVSSKPANDSDLLNVENEVGLLDSENAENTTSLKKDNTIVEEIKEEKEVLTNSDITSNEYFIKSRLERDTMYSQMIESYQKILDKTTVSESQKNTAQKEIGEINEQKKAIMITENIIKTKGFEDLVIFINDNSINVIIKAKELNQEQVAQIQNIITRELEADIENIHISNKE